MDLRGRGPAGRRDAAARIAGARRRAAAPGRIGGTSPTAGHDVVGVDGDPVLIAEAQARAPGRRAGWSATSPSWTCRPQGSPSRSTSIVCAGNVMTFLAVTRASRCCAGCGRTSSPAAARPSASAPAAATSSTTSSPTPRRRLGARPAAVHLGPAPVHARRRLPGRRPAPRLTPRGPPGSGAGHAGLGSGRGAEPSVDGARRARLRRARVGRAGAVLRAVAVGHPPARCALLGRRAAVGRRRPVLRWTGARSSTRPWRRWR